MRKQLLEIEKERVRQDLKWGADKHPGSGLWSLVLMEEVGEEARAAMTGDIAALRNELVQVAAVAVAWVESLDDGRAQRSGEWWEAMTREAFEAGRKSVIGEEVDHGGK